MKLVYNGEFFNVKDTLECGQVFRFIPHEKGYKVFSRDKCCYAYNEGDNAVIECQDEDKEYFENYFDVYRDYSLIYNSAVKEGVDILKRSATAGKGIRILNQDKTETLFSFIISQNNNISRIKGIIERLCESLGEKRVFRGETYYAFPSAEIMSKKDENFYKEIGLGYRAEYVRRLAVEIDGGYNIEVLSKLSTDELKRELVSIYGVGAKVANCVTLFAFGRSKSFPVDTWIEKVYVNDFKGNIKNRDKITEYFINRFGENAGYFQQYLFFYKRLEEKLIKSAKNQLK